jgi:protein-disulfide isomerase
MDHKAINQDFAKGVGVGILVILSLGFILQNISGVSLGGSNKILKKTNPTPTVTDTNPDTGEIAPADIVISDVTTDDHIYGNPKAEISLVEFSDLECPFCTRFHPTPKQIVDASNGTVNWVYRHFPLSSIHPDAQKLAEASECAAELGGNDKFWTFIDKVLTDAAKPAQIEAVADAVGIDGAKVVECMNSGKYAQKVNDQYNEALAAGGRGTPYTIVVNADGEKAPINGALPLEQAQAIVDSLK